MPTLSRYIWREMLHFTALSLAIFTGMLVIARMLKLVSMVVNKGVDPLQIIAMFVAIIPTFLEVAIPVATLLGVMLAFARLSGDSEVIVMRASGISFGQLLKPVIVFGLAATLASFAVSLHLRAWGYQKLATSLYEIVRSRTISGLTEGIFNDLGKLTIYTESIDYNSGDMQRVLVDDRRQDDTRQVIVAQRAVLAPDDSQRTVLLQLSDGTIHASSSSGSYTVTRFSQNNLEINAADVVEEARKDPAPREMYLPELRQAVVRTAQLAAEAQLPIYTAPPAPGSPAEREERRREQELKEVRKERVRASWSARYELARKFSFPLGTMVFAMLAMPFGIHPARTHRTWGPSISAALGLLLIVCYYGALSIGIALSKKGTLSVAAGVWLPNLIFIALAAYVLRQMHGERWQSVVQPFEAWLKRWRKPA